MDAFDELDLIQEPADPPISESEAEFETEETVPAPQAWNPDDFDPPVSKTSRRKKKKKTYFSLFSSLIVCLIAVIAVTIICGTAVRYVNSCISAQNKRNEQLMNQLNQKLEDLQAQINSGSAGGSSSSNDGTYLTPAQVYARNVQGIVFVTNVSTTTKGDEVTNRTSRGSGFIISQDGFIVTNHHVVENATTLTITLYDGTDYPARLVGSDSANDLAVIKVEAEGLHALQFGSSNNLIVGEQIVVIGNPLGELTYTLTSGYVSAKNRPITTSGFRINMIQVDAAVNSGNSGGPMFNMKGEVVGIVTAKYSGLSTSGASIEGIGFAVPVDDVIRKINDLVKYGYITGAQLGVTVHDVDQNTAEYYNLPLGVYVKSVVLNSCAKAAGVQPKDIIIGLGDYGITSMNDLSSALQRFKGGDATTITVWRSGKEMKLDIVLDAKKPS